jgi:hypothetical protein
MHGPASCGQATTGSRRGARTRRIAARTTGTLEDRPATLDSTGTGWATLWRSGTRRRRTVDRPWAGLRHDDALDRRGRGGRDFRRLRSRRSRSRGNRRRRRGRHIHCRSHGRRHTRARSRRHWRRSRGSRLGDHRASRGRRSSNRRAVRAVRCGGRSRRYRRTSDDRARRRLRSNRWSLRRRRGHNRRCRARLRHDNTARWRCWSLCFGRRRSRCARRRSRTGGQARRGGRLHGWRRSLRPWRRTLSLFLALLDRLQYIAGLRHPRPVDLWRSASFALACARAAVTAAPTLEMRAHTLRLVSFERARMGLGVRHSDFTQYVQNRLALNFEFSC